MNFCLKFLWKSKFLSSFHHFEVYAKNNIMEIHLLYWETDWTIDTTSASNRLATELNRLFDFANVRRIVFHSKN